MHATLYTSLYSVYEAYFKPIFKTSLIGIKKYRMNFPDATKNKESAIGNYVDARGWRRRRWRRWRFHKEAIFYPFVCRTRSTPRCATSHHLCLIPIIYLYNNNCVTDWKEFAQRFVFWRHDPGFTYSLSFSYYNVLKEEK